MQPHVSIIIPTRNRKEKLLACIESLRFLNYSNYEIIVVDNASTDGSPVAIKCSFPEVRVVELTENTGIGGGRNQGMRHACGDFFCFIDDDNLVDSGLLRELVSIAQSHEDIGFLGPMMYYNRKPENIWCAGVVIDLLTSRAISTLEKAENKERRDFWETEVIPNVVMVKRQVVDEIGVVDPVYVMTYGDADWPFRARRAGYRCVICPKAKVYHDVEDFSGTAQSIMTRGNAYRTYYFARNRVIFMKKFAKVPAFVLFLALFNTIFLLVYSFIYLRHRRPDLVRIYVNGWLAGLVIARRVRRIITGREEAERLKLDPAICMKPQKKGGSSYEFVGRKVI